MADVVKDGRLNLSVADPDLNMTPTTRGQQSGANQPRLLRVTLRGAWRLLSATGTLCAFPLPKASESVRVLSTDGNQTVLEIVCRHGASYDISVAR